MPSSAIGWVLESVLRSVLASITEPGWECAIESYWNHTVKHTGSV
jgi:hypothetical protein